MSNQPIPSSEDLHQSEQLQSHDDQLGVLLEGAKSCPVFGSESEGRDLSSFELPHWSTVSTQKGEILGSDQMLHGGMDIGQSSGKHAECSTDIMQLKESDDEDTSKEDSKLDGGNKQQKRRRSAELHNLTERLRRQRIKEKMQTLQELIPNCNKRDKTSTLDDAIKYIKTLQYQVQMMSIGAGFTMWHSPWMLPPQPGQQGVQIPRLPPLLQTVPRPGIGYGYHMAGPSSSVNFPMTRLGLPSNTCSLASASSGLMPLHGMSDVQSVQNSDTFSFATSLDMSGAFCARTDPSFGSQCTTQGENSPFKQ